MLNVGLVGFGFAGKTFHAPVIRVVEGLRLTTIVQRHGEGAPDPRYAAVEFVSSVDELLSRALDLVVIATPNTSHHPIAKQCLQAGRHVVIDKPFTTTVAEAEDLVQLAEAKRSEEHTSELQSPCNLVCRLLLEKKKKIKTKEVYLRLDKTTQSTS